MPYPQIVEYNEAVQHPAHAFTDAELKLGSVKQTSLGLPLVLSGGFALTYTLSTSRKKYAVRCFKHEIPSIEQRYNEISKKLKSLGNGYFVNFDFQRGGIKVQQSNFPIVKMDWVEGDPLGVWLDKNFNNVSALQKLRADFSALATFLEREGIAHGDIQNGNVMLSGGVLKLIDYDGMFVPGLPQGKGTEMGQKHFQHPDRAESHFGPTMDRFSFIALDLSLQAIIFDKSLYKRFRDGGETIIFKANDFADPQNSEIFRLLRSQPSLKAHAEEFAAICDADIGAVPTLSDFLAGKNIPTAKSPNVPGTAVGIPIRPAEYISAFPVVNALEFETVSRHIGNKVELIGKIAEVRHSVTKRGRRPYVFINFGPWRGNKVKIAIWSEGLVKLNEKPSNSWVGRWVSVTGLVDAPYTNPRYRYTHISITLQEDGQIQRLDENQAQFRLASAGKLPSPRNREIVDEVLGRKTKDPTRQTSSPGTGRSPGGTKSNKDIVKEVKARATLGAPQTASSVQTAPPTQAQSAFAKVPGWVWIVGVIAVLLLLSLLNRPKAPVPTNPPPADPPILRPLPSPPESTQPAPPRQRPDSGRSLPKSDPPQLPPPIEIPPPANPPLLLLDQVEDARRVQQRLIELGFLLGPADGIWGPRSRRALQDFRIAQNIGQGDTWDETTQQLLFGESAVRAPRPSITPESFVGGWGIDLADCRQSQGGRGNLTITARRAEAFGTACEFQSVQQEGANMWRLQAKCANSSERWNANIRFTIFGNKLIWSSERGTVNYVRCSG